jgi:hypothetical protein
MTPAIAKRLQALEQAALPTPVTKCELVAAALPDAPKAEREAHEQFLAEAHAEGVIVIEMVPLQPRAPRVEPSKAEVMVRTWVKPKRSSDGSDD